MTGWFADFIRLAGGLIYWNVRKSWFQLRQGRARCPCQSPSDSGRGMETHCEASVQWNKARRFRRVCPLLVETPQGWRCSVDTKDVRPFWGRFFCYYGGTVGGIYLACVLAVFIFLRVVGYPVSILHVGWPPSWHRVGQARGWYFTEKARRAFDANRTGEALLYLSNAYEFDPGNYTAGLTLAKTLQSGQPVPSDRIYERLYREHAPRREDTAEEWFRALIARGDFISVQELARDRLASLTPHNSAWMRALVFATRQTGRDEPLRKLLGSDEPAVTAWRPLIETELLVLAGRTAEAHNRVALGDWRQVPAYGVYYQVEQLIAFDDVFAALDRMGALAAQLDAETRTALKLSAFAHEGARRPFQQQVDLVLSPRLNLAAIKILSVQLIRRSDPVILDQLYQKLQREPVPFNTESAGVYFSLLCAIGVQGDWEKFSAVGKIITAGSGMSTPFLLGIEGFFRGRSTSSRATSILPVLPLPTEAVYAMIERYPTRPAGTPAKGKK